jgi:transcription-repair coupling factor (superfamily II helicase)
MRATCFQPTLPKAGNTLNWQNLPGASLSLAVANTLTESSQFHLLVTEDMLQAHQLATELKFYLRGHPKTQVEQFPDWEILPYDNFSPHEDIISARITACYKLQNQQLSALIVPISTLLHRLAPPSHIIGQTFLFKCGDPIDREQLRNQLMQGGYRHVSQVLTHGEFSFRGSIIDIFPMGSEVPIRIDCFDDVIEHLKSFDPDTQRSSATLSSFRVLPAREFPLHEEAINCFRHQWREKFGGNPLHCPIYEAVSAGIAPAGIEYYLPLFFPETATLFDYLPEHTQIIRCGDILTQADNCVHALQKRYTQLRYDICQPILPPESITLGTNQVFECFKPFAQITVQSASQKHVIDYQITAPPPVNIDYKASDAFALLKQHLASTTTKTLLVAESSGRREVIRDLLLQQRIDFQLVEDWQAFLSSSHPLTLTVGDLIEGFTDPHNKLTVLTESNLFTQHITQARRRKQKQADVDFLIRDLTELKIGQPIVHIQHGVGHYRGLVRLQVSGITAEYIQLEYADQDKIYVPVTSLHLISRYSGQDHPLIHKLGQNKWLRAKGKALEKIHDVAVELLELYAQREAKVGHAFTLPETAYQHFASEFPFELTTDQERALTQVIEDMTSTRCMDRLICGDVGFGKTEIALRASFIAAFSGTQVACLVPTTLLAEQHYQTFSDRFADFPIRIELLSRFRSPAQLRATLAGLSAGQVDIVIGTHSLLQKTVKFSNLGLLIVDEEHRFGVKQKDRIKALRTQVDILTLTATPIPRTLNMSLSGVRDISIIATPPARRLSIKTLLIKTNTAIIREAIMREVNRGGQVFYIHNSVKTIAHTTQELSSLVPEARIRFAHGQMPERDLETIMSDFCHRRFNLLVCTTIIENGIDIPTANTIIIDKADRFGLAQLHQLRGRVGRSHHQAYAYLLIKDKKAMTADANKRLQSFASMTELGAGFSLAVHDLEIRGSGEILGEGQSGHIDAIGYSLYMELLERTLKWLQTGKTTSLELIDKPGTEVNCQVQALIPEHYMPDPVLRLTHYKRLANAATSTDLRNLQTEMIDRFGLLPAELKRLYRVTELKLQANALGVCKVEANAQGGSLEFVSKPNIELGQILSLVQQSPKMYQLSGPNTLRFRQAITDHDLRLDTIQNILADLTPQTSRIKA